MVKLPHEALHHVFRKSPNLIAETIQRAYEVDFPEIVESELVDTDLTEIAPMVRRPDTVIKALTERGPQLLVVEAQTREAPSKIRSWAYYLSYLESKYEIPATLLVVTPSAATARWARGPLRLGPPGLPSLELSPFVVGPDNLPVITEIEQAVEGVDLAVLAALTNRFDPDIEKALELLAQAIDTIPPDQRAVWADLTEVGLEGCAQEFWRQIMQTMQYEFGSRLALESITKERARAVLKTLDMRAIPVSEGERVRIEGCTDLDMLEGWFTRAFEVERTEDLF
ncbi:hypothetical protein [Glycomyces paridis]|uniref:Rpn family recombination-promoting nuclease/putative transposase n=1 Tax=Glycomyces paridis TaxID=2126555 RepID=A0A4S8PL00_9ACTN|nr:hypothetical protein [Glycomyces paridis]THV30252.1 hypothetical protein E9998_07755 [Glycomyces paridis]